ncbi:MAG: septal ring lytic transglycosylase RlpA family protein [Trueperaceae bacterium]|nr:septal ring lytic transglycosylase RlpA family protein [Trueperaceae bacterium]
MRWLFLCLLVLLTSCTPGLTTNVIQSFVAQANAPTDNHSIEGRASWYGPKFAGRKTANGEIFDPSQLTAAHKTLPFGTLVRVYNLDNGTSVVVRINDRGPFKPGRIIDLSKAAAESLGMIGSGTAQVKLELLSSTAPSTLSAARASANRASPVADQYKLASDPQLSGFNIASEHFPVGQLLLFSSTQETLMVRVSSSTMPISSGVDFFVSPELYSRMGEVINLAPVN